MLKKGLSWGIIGTVTLILLEGLLQIAFAWLPLTLTTRLPQYTLRYGVRYDTPHGAREYPANERVNRLITPNTGDLYAISCVTPSSAPAFEPYTVSYQRDEHGFRNGSPYPDSADIVVLGDSFTAGETVNTPYYEGIAENVLMLGLPGSGTREQARLFSYFAKPRRPKTVILAFFGGNDVADNGYFSRLAEQGTNAYEYANRNRMIWEYSLLFQMGMLIRQRFTAPTATDCPYPLTLSDGTPIAFYNTFLENNSIDAETLAGSRLFGYTLESLLQIAQETQSNGGKFIVMYIPYKAQVYWDLLTESQQNRVVSTLVAQTTDTYGFRAIPEAESGFKQYYNVQRDLLQATAKLQNWGFLDLTPLLQAQAKVGNHAYFYADTHWNQNGHDLVRNALRDYLRAMPE